MFINIQVYIIYTNFLPWLGSLGFKSHKFSRVKITVVAMGLFERSVDVGEIGINQQSSDFLREWLGWDWSNFL